MECASAHMHAHTLVGSSHSVNITMMEILPTIFVNLLIICFPAAVTMCVLARCIYF